MSGKYQAYPEYKDSGVEWLGSIPSHWKVGRLGSFGYFTAGCGFPHEYQGQSHGQYPFYKVSDTNLPGNEKFLDQAENYVSQKVAMQLGARISKPGGIMFPKVGAALLGNKRRILTHSSITDNNTMVYASYDGDFEYWYYWLSELDFGQISNPGPVPSVNEGQLKDFPAIFPPIAERNSIAAFLDHETARIDQLIEKQQRLIELLKEKRQAVISHAVTKGLDPNVPMKDSGVEWLGKVPEHWGVLKIRYVTSKVTTGGTPTDKAAFVESEGISWFTPGDFKEDIELKHASKQVSYDSVSTGDAKLYPKNSVVMVGIGATLGKVGFVTHQFSANQQINILVPNNRSLVQFLTYAIVAQFEQIKLAANASTLGIINQDKTKQIIIAVPPYEEQLCIQEYLASFDVQTAKALDKSALQIALLQERRTALISAAVTGKIDVRGWQPPAKEDAA